MVTQPRWLRALSLATVTALAAAIVACIPVVAAQADTAPAAGTASTVSSDSLPTAQVNGVVWSQIIVGNTVYVGGSFTQGMPPGSTGGAGAVTRNNMLAYNLTTGALISGFAPSFNAQVRSLAASPDGSTIYAVGNFTQVNGVNRYRVVALDATTGAVKTNFAPTLNTAAYAVVATSSTVYVGGAFTVVGSSSTRTRAAAFSASNGALTSWAPNIPDNIVRAMVISPDGSKVVLGGSFSSLNGSTSPGEGLGAVDTVTGANLPWAVGQTVYDHGANASIMSLWSDGTNVYGSGYVFGGVSDGNLEGAFNASWADGSINWVEDCHGDTYGVAAMGGAVYTVSHAHYCGNLPNGFDQTDPNPSKAIHQHALAFSKATTGVLGHDPYGPPYVDWGGTPSPSLLTWYPDLTTGTVTGQSQAAWTVTAGSGYVLLGGEFPTVNGTAQAGLARFATSSVAPNTDGPRLSGYNWTPNAVSLQAGTVRVSWPSNWDRDNGSLKYSLYRVGTTTPVYTTTSESEGFWLRPTLGFVDSGLTPGAKMTYKVTATDPFGNTATSAYVNATVSAGSGSSAYSKAVIADGASDYWRLGEANGPSVYDWAGYNDMTANGGVTFGTAGAIAGDSNTAATFSGDQTGFASTGSPIAGPQTFSIETWFKTTSTAGGKIVGFGSSSTGTSSSYDRHVYMDTAGHVLFGVYPGYSAVVQSGSTYNDGNWHYVVASLSSAGQQLYVDGKRVGSNPGVTSAQAYDGYWRIGGDTSWSGANFFAGSIDDTAIYPTAISAATVKAHWVDSGNGTSATAPSDAYGAQVFANGPDSYWRLGDPAGSTTVADASGNGVTATANSGVTFGAPGGTKGSSSTAATFDGSSGLVVSSQAENDPTVYSLELWFNTTTTSGGKLIGFGDQTSGLSGNYDRHVWMLDSGQLEFGTWTGQANTITSSSSYNDGMWHHMVATQGPDGMNLYVDGVSVGTNPQTSAQSYSGYWRLGGDTTWGGNSSNYFAGTMDEVAIYSSELTAGQVANDYQVGASGANIPPTASFTATATDLSAAFDSSSSSDKDGSITGWAWSFGDGSTGTGASPTHRYAAAGSYTVSLTVTDNKGATNTVSKQITVTAPNLPPTASFTSSASGLTGSFDGSGSSDPDGTVASYAWSFGDSSTGTGRTATHTYAAAGTYTVSLTVTDNQGATNTATKSVTITAPAANHLASDAFGRTVTGGLGTADTGGAWTVSGGSSNFAVGSGSAAFSTQANATLSSYLNAVSAPGSDVSVAVTIPKLPVSGTLSVGVVGRRVGTDDYSTYAIVSSTGSVTLAVLHGSAGIRQVTLPSSITVSAGTVLHIRMTTTTASGTTTLRARTWLDGTTQPTTWQVTGTDTTAAMQVAGSVGLRARLSSSTTNAPIVFQFDDFVADPAS